jgi:predicted transcriptional regulator
MSEDANPVELATELTIAWLANPNTRTSADDVPAFLNAMHEAVSKLSSGRADLDIDTPTVEHTPAVSVRKSLASRDYIVSLIDGKKYKTLRRHLAGHDLTPDQYRQRYNLKRDYPMVAESYSEARRTMAKKIGLGRKPASKSAQAETDSPPAKQRRSRAKSGRSAQA